MHSESATTTPEIALTEPDGPGKGNFKATPLEFNLDGETYTYAGRGRWSVQLATVVANGGMAPVKNKDGTWDWREATTSELAAANKLVDKIADKLRAKAEATAAKVAARATKSGKAPIKHEDKTEAAVEATV